MARVTLKGIKEAPDRMAPVPGDDYEVVFENYEDRAKKDAPDAPHHWNCELRIVGGDHDNHPLWYICPQSEKGLGITKRFLKAFGIPIEEDDSFDLDEGKGCHAMVRVVQEEGQDGEPTNRVTKVWAIG